MDPKRTTYDTGSMVLHWAVAVLVFSVGLTSPFLDHQLRPALSTFHNMGGTLALLLSVVWIVWQRQRTVIPRIATIVATEQWLMTLSISAMNVLLVLASVSGLILLFAHGGTLGVGALTISYRIGIDQQLVQWLSLLHHGLGALLVMIAGGHALHSAWHHIVRQDRLLARILPWHERQ